MPFIPPILLQKLYVKGSLRLVEGGFAFDLRNTIAPATIIGIDALEVDGRAIDIVPEAITIQPEQGTPRNLKEISRQKPVYFSIYKVITVHVAGQSLSAGPHKLVVRVNVKEVGPIDIPISDTVAN
ncbi:MAG: hypothetical protein N2508_09980 [Anaerolineae bacterium]|nr:hypothetical protein [Anaerolineae bacterium]